MKKSMSSKVLFSLLAVGFAAGASHLVFADESPDSPTSADDAAVAPAGHGGGGGNHGGGGGGGNHGGGGHGGNHGGGGGWVHGGGYNHHDPAHGGYGHDGHWHNNPYPIEHGGDYWIHWDHPPFDRPVYDWEWDHLRTVTCTAEDSSGDFYPVTESDYYGIDYQAQMDNIEDQALDFCYADSSDEGCFLVDCTPGY